MEEGATVEHAELGPAIWTYPFAQEQADGLLATLRALPEESWAPSLVLDHDTPHQARTSFHLEWDDALRPVRLQLHAMFDACLRHYNRRFHTQATTMEKVGLLRYLPGETYRPHVDSSWKSYRVVSGLVYLDPTGYEGGETWFPRFDISVKPDRPSVVLFPANYAYLHEARPVVSGVKYVAVTWISDLPKGESVRSRSETAPVNSA